MNYLIFVLMGITFTSCSSPIKMSAELKVVDGDDSIEFEVSGDIEQEKK